MSIVRSVEQAAECNVEHAKCGSAVAVILAHNITSLGQSTFSLQEHVEKTGQLLRTHHGDGPSKPVLLILEIQQLLGVLLVHVSVLYP